MFGQGWGIMVNQFVRLEFKCQLHCLKGNTWLSELAAFTHCSKLCYFSALSSFGKNAILKQPFSLDHLSVSGSNRLKSLGTSKELLTDFLAPSLASWLLKQDANAVVLIQRLKYPFGLKEDSEFFVLLLLVGFLARKLQMSFDVHFLFI